MADAEKPKTVTASKNVLHDGKLHPRGTAFPMAPSALEAHTDRAKARDVEPAVISGDKSEKIQAEMAEDEEDVQEPDEKTGEMKTIRRKKTKK